MAARIRRALVGKPPFVLQPKSETYEKATPFSFRSSRRYLLRVPLLRLLFASLPLVVADHAV